VKAINFFPANYFSRPAEKNTRETVFAGVNYSGKDVCTGGERESAQIKYFSRPAEKKLIARWRILCFPRDT
jgi:hypothetical protein